MKTCSMCGEIKEFVAFSKKKANKDGLQDRCKDCVKKSGKQWREANPKYNKQRYSNNNKEHLKYCKQWYIDNRDKCLEYSKQRNTKGAPFVYRIKLNDKVVYYGESKLPGNDRWSRHKSAARCSRSLNYNHPIQQAIRQFGEDAFTFEKMKYYPSKRLAHKVEQHLIAKFKPIYNSNRKKRKP